MHRKNKVRIIVIVTAFFLFSVAFLGSFNDMLYNRKFYNMEYEKNGVYDSLGHERADAMTTELFSYLQGKGTLSDEYFNEKEQRHLSDVRSLINIGTIKYHVLLAMLLMLFFVLFIMDRKRFAQNLQKIFIYSGLGIVLFSLTSFILSSHFDYLFIRFHELLFSNNLWLLNPATDKLIVLLPQQFFMDFVSAAYVRSLVVAFAMLFLALLIFVYKKRSGGK